MGHIRKELRLRLCCRLSFVFLDLNDLQEIFDILRFLRCYHDLAVVPAYQHSDHCHAYVKYAEAHYKHIDRNAAAEYMVRKKRRDCRINYGRQKYLYLGEGKVAAECRHADARKERTLYRAEASAINAVDRHQNDRNYALNVEFRCACHLSAENKSGCGYRHGCVKHSESIGDICKERCSETERCYYPKDHFAHKCL